MTLWWPAFYCTWFLHFSKNNVKHGPAQRHGLKEERKEKRSKGTDSRGYALNADGSDDEDKELS